MLCRPVSSFILMLLLKIVASGCIDRDFQSLSILYQYALAAGMAYGKSRMSSMKVRNIVVTLVKFVQ